MKRFLYYFWSATWNCISTFIGIFIVLALLITGHRPHMFGPTICFKLNQQWSGGFSMSFVTVTSGDCESYDMLAHEYGHSLQGLVFGPLMLFIISIPSAIRYWYRSWYYEKYGADAYFKLTRYDSIWFEKTATRYGKRYSNKGWYQDKD
jgi:hypothetical protein